MPTATELEVVEVLRQAKQLARRYHELTRKPEAPRAKVPLILELWALCRLIMTNL